MASQGYCAVYEKESVVRGHHIYKAIWTPVIGEELDVQTEDSNHHDQHAVAVVKDGVVIGHMPRLVAEVSWFFLKRGGSITCRITGSKKFGVGLEVPCIYVYSSSAKTVKKLSKLLDHIDQPQSCPH